jgi:phosphopantetheine adenylyltransferase
MSENKANQLFAQRDFNAMSLEDKKKHLDDLHLEAKMMDVEEEIYEHERQLVKGYYNERNSSPEMEKGARHYTPKMMEYHMSMYHNEFVIPGNEEHRKEHMEIYERTETKNYESLTEEKVEGHLSTDQKFLVDRYIRANSHFEGTGITGEDKQKCLNKMFGREMNHNAFIESRRQQQDEIQDSIERHGVVSRYETKEVESLDTVINSNKTYGAADKTSEKSFQKGAEELSFKSIDLKGNMTRAKSKMKAIGKSAKVSLMKVSKIVAKKSLSPIAKAATKFAAVTSKFSSKLNKFVDNEAKQQLENSNVKMKEVVASKENEKSKEKDQDKSIGL